MKNKIKVTAEAIGSKKSMPMKDVTKMIERVAEESYELGKDNAIKRCIPIIRQREKRMFWRTISACFIGFIIGQIISYFIF